MMIIVQFNSFVMANNNHSFQFQNSFFHYNDKKLERSNNACPNLEPKSNYLKTKMGNGTTKFSLTRKGRQKKVKRTVLALTKD